MNSDAAAMPLLPVTAVVVVMPLANKPEAPDIGAKKYTGTPVAGLLFASATETAKGTANVCPIAADCGVEPAIAVIAVAAPRTLAREKITFVRPAALAVTL